MDFSRWPGPRWPQNSRVNIGSQPAASTTTPERSQINGSLSLCAEELTTRGRGTCLCISMHHLTASRTASGNSFRAGGAAANDAMNRVLIV